MRGEHILEVSIYARGAGSSPRAWGTLVTRLRIFRSSRFIPTCVGNTVYKHVERVVDTVHPHVRGEHASKVLNNLNTGGSSPRAWGTRDDPIILGVFPRFIPTCVGNTTPADNDRFDTRGSSPRAWGTRCNGHNSTFVTRFIPTCVGNTHPYFVTYTLAIGSSPRAWGTLRARSRLSSWSRFIPTCVGNTLS